MKVGDYYRFDDGMIVKCTKIETYKTKNNIYYFDNILDWHEDRACNDNTICENQLEHIGEIKSSPNIIDLIEEGDFINGCRITEIKSNKNGVLKCILDSDYEFITTIVNSEIETVVTKEQFESMEYKVGGK